MSTGGLDSPPARAPIWDTERGVTADGPRPGAAAQKFAIACIGVGTLIWLVGVLVAESDTDSPFGLLANTAATTAAAVVLLSLAFCAACRAPHAHRGTLLTGTVAALAVVVHGTPALITGDLRNARLRLGVGAAEQAAITGQLDVSGSAAHSGDWGGTRALLAALSDASGLSAESITRWAPVAIVAISLTAIWLLCRTMGFGPRTAATAQWLFVAGSWIGAEHLTSAALGAALAIAIVAVLLPFDGAHAPAGLFPATTSSDRVGALASVVLLAALGVVTVALINPLASLGLIFVLAVAARVRAAYTWWAAALAGVATVLVSVGPVRSSSEGLGETLTTHRGAPIETSGSTALADVIDQWNVVLVAGRFVALILFVVAMIGLFVMRRAGRSINLLGIMCVVPFVVALVLDPSFEHVYQAMFIALPWLAIAAAIGVRPLIAATTSDNRRWALAGQFALLVLIAAAGVVAASGQERARDLGGAVSAAAAAPAVDAAPLGPLTDD